MASDELTAASREYDELLWRAARYKKAEAERDRLQRDYDDILKWMAESDAGKLAARCKQLREALERIRSFTTFEVQDSFPIYEVDAIARNALAGGSERETPDPE